MEEESKRRSLRRRALAGVCLALVLAVLLGAGRWVYERYVPYSIEVSKVPSAAKEKQIEQAMKRIGDAWLRYKPTAAQLSATTLGVYYLKDSLAGRMLQHLHLDSSIMEYNTGKRYPSRYGLVCREFEQHTNRYYHDGRQVSITRGFWLVYDSKTRSVLHIPAWQVHWAPSYQVQKPTLHSAGGSQGNFQLPLFPNDPRYADLYAHTTNGSIPGVNIVE